MWMVSEAKRKEGKCIALVADHTGFHFFQCSRKARFALEGDKIVPGEQFCKQHAKAMLKRLTVLIVR